MSQVGSISKVSDEVKSGKDICIIKKGKLYCVWGGRGSWGSGGGGSRVCVWVCGVLNPVGTKSGKVIKA